MKELIIRNYTDSDKEVCRELWLVLTQRHCDIYDDASIEGEDPGQFFDEHLDSVGQEHIWIAEIDGQTVGMVGLMQPEPNTFEVEPVVVFPEYRGKEIGTQLLKHAVHFAKGKGTRFVSVRPVMRNKEAIRLFHRLGFGNIGRVEFFMDLESNDNWCEETKLFDYEFNY